MRLRIVVIVNEEQNQSVEIRNGDDSIAVLCASHTLSVHYSLADYSAAKNNYLSALLHLLALFVEQL